MTTSIDILEGKEGILGYIVRNRKYIFVASILIFALYQIMKKDKKSKHTEGK